MHLLVHMVIHLHLEVRGGELARWCCPLPSSCLFSSSPTRMPHETDHKKKKRKRTPKRSQIPFFFVSKKKRCGASVVVAWPRLVAAHATCALQACDASERRRSSMARVMVPSSWRAARPGACRKDGNGCQPHKPNVRTPGGNPRGSPRAANHTKHGERKRWTVHANTETSEGNPPNGSWDEDMCGLVDVELDNQSDQQSTTVRITGSNRPGLLMSVAQAFQALNLQVVDAMIKTDPEGQVADVFRITDAKGRKIEEQDWDSIRQQVEAACVASNQSSLPDIYGVSMNSTDRLGHGGFIEEMKQGSRDGSQGSVDGNLVPMPSTASALELAAANMADAAARLVAIEREMEQLFAKLRLGDVEMDPQVIDSRETARAEAAALLERRMAAMEAALAARRTGKVSVVVEPEGAEGGRFAEGGAIGTGPAAGSGREIILQAFNWESCHEQEGWYNRLVQELENYVSMGFTTMWLPPPTDSVSPQGYLPRDLYCFNSKYGSEGELRNLLRIMREQGIFSVADVVINHRCAHYQSDDGKWNQFGGRLSWDPSVITSDNPTFGGQGGRGSGEDYHAAPNIDHSQERVRNDLKQWLKTLKNVGFDGWRFDFVKGYAGHFTRDYIDATVPLMAFGEFWTACEYTDGVLNYNQNRHRQSIVDWCDATGGTAAAFDFTTKGILQEALGKGECWRLSDDKGQPPGVIGIWPSRAITFLENHDTGSTLQHWPFPTDQLHAGYAYILTHPGTPVVFYDHLHYFGDLKNSIMALLSIRKRKGINARSRVTIRRAVGDVYAASIDDKVCVKVGNGSWSPNDERILFDKYGEVVWEVASSGPGFAVWELTRPSTN